jgi:hypothetical protein
VATALLCWGIAVGGGYAVARWWPGLGPGGPWTVASIYGVILGVFMFARFKAGGWKSIRLDSQDAIAKVRGFEVQAATQVSGQ